MDNVRDRWRRPAGVELAGAIVELARHGLEREFRAIDPANATVVLVQSAPRLLPAFPPTLSIDAATALRKLGVTVRLDAKVEQISAEGVVLAGELVTARTVLWAAGVHASPAGAWLDAERDRAGRVVVGEDLSVKEHDRVFAIGDVAACLAWRGQPVPGLAPAAKQGGHYVAKVSAEDSRDVRRHRRSDTATQETSPRSDARLRLLTSMASWFMGRSPGGYGTELMCCSWSGAETVPRCLSTGSGLT